MRLLIGAVILALLSAFGVAFICKWFDLRIDDTGIILIFVGILATFIVVSNYAQVKDIERKAAEHKRKLEEKFNNEIGKLHRKENLNIILSVSYCVLLNEEKASDLMKFIFNNIIFHFKTQLDDSEIATKNTILSNFIKNLAKTKNDGLYKYIQDEIGKLSLLERNNIGSEFLSCILKITTPNK